MVGEDAKSLQEDTRHIRHATFECAACGSGTENFLTLFVDGTCSHCGNPAGVVVETSRPQDIEKIRQSIMVVSSEKDARIAKQIMKEMLEEGIAVIDPTIVVDNEQAGNRANVLTFLANECRYVLVIPSDEGQVSDNRLVSAAIEQAMIHDRGNIAPLYPDSTYRGRPSTLEGIRGVQWSGSSEMVSNKKSFLDQLKIRPLT
jgi:hypothetical protein